MEQNNQTPKKSEFYFQIGIVVFLLVAIFIPTGIARYICWAVAILCGIGWVVSVNKNSKQDEKDD